MIQIADCYNALYRDKEHFIILVTGGRGCERPDQEVIMADSSVKEIRYIGVGDRVMGDDYTPRNVLATFNGHGTMYKVCQSDGTSYCVNDAHILTLFDVKRQTMIDVNVEEAIDRLKRGERLRGVQIKNVRGKLQKEIRRISIKNVGVGEWYGIHLDGNQRYLHKDGTITHNSGKSFSASTFIERLTFDMGKGDKGELIPHGVLFCRYTMTSAGISVIPEFMEKIEQDGTGRYFSASRTDVVNVATGAKIMFRGIKTSSGNQTAKLKSIHGITTFVVDEAEEWTSSEEFEKIMLSIRQKGIQNRVIIIMNPTDSNHFIYQKYIKDTHKIVEYDGVPVQISTHPSVLHIHTSYLDNIQHLGDEFLKEIQQMKESDPERYAHIVMGKWADVAEGAVFKKWGIVEEFPRLAKSVALGIDFGYACFVGDTLIATNKGFKRIRDIKEGDFVLTRKGYCRVNELIDKGVQKVTTTEIVLKEQTITITATNDHKIYTKETWKSLKNLAEGDILNIVPNLTDKSSSGDLVENTPTTFIARTAVKNNYTALYMSITMGKFRLTLLFTTSTETHSITTLKTLLRFHVKNTQKYIKKVLKRQRKKAKSCERKELKTDIQKKIGKREGTRFCLLCNKKLGLAKGAERNIDPQTPISVSVQNVVIIGGNTQQKQTTLKWSVKIAEKCLWETNTLNRNHVAKNVHTLWCEIKKVRKIKESEERVYDISVRGNNEYYANGILVHNCDPTAIVKCGIIDNRLYIDEVCYKTNMLASDIVRELRPVSEAPDGTRYMVIADSADPRLIQEIANGGILIYAVQKGAGSVLAGLTKMKEYEIYVTKRSVNLQEELRNYTWDKDKDGNYINQPIDAYNHCFVGETMVATKDGEKRIIDIREGDVVLTSDGYHKVTRFFNQGVRKAQKTRIYFDGFFVEVTATPDHKIKTQNEWKELSKIKKGDTLFVKRSMASSITNIVANDILVKVVKDYTALCGNTTTDKFRRGFTYTTKMGTQRITTLATLNSSRGVNIRNYTQKYTSKTRNIWRRLAKTLTRLVSKRISGTNQQKEELGTLNTPNSLNAQTSRVYVNIAERRFYPKYQQQNFAQTAVKQHTDTTMGRTTRSVSVRGAEQNLSLIDTQVQSSARVLAPDNITLPCVVRGVEILSEGFYPVFDIEVEDVHEFYANGILVSNCIDASRYFVLGKLLGQIQNYTRVRPEEINIF